MRNGLRTVCGIVSNIDTAKSLLQWAWPYLVAGVPAVVAVIITHFKQDAWFAVLVAVLAMATTVLVAYFVTKSPRKKLKDQSGSVLPYVRTVNASPLYDGRKSYLSIVMHFPNWLENEVRLTLEGRVIIDGRESLPLDNADVRLSKGTGQVTDWHAPFAPDDVDYIKGRIDHGLPVAVVAKIRDRDKKDEFHWETEAWTTLLLTKLS